MTTRDGKRPPGHDPYTGMPDMPLPGRAKRAWFGRQLTCLPLTDEGRARPDLLGPSRERTLTTSF